MRYASAQAFRQALEERTRQDYQGKDIPRIRKMIAFERLMARLDRHWILKGGYAIQLRTERARTTQDVDLLVMDISVDEIENTFRRELENNLGDYFEYIISRSDMIAGEQAIRFLVTSRVAGRIFERFHVDVGYKDPVLQPIEHLIPPNYLAFAEIETVRIPCYSIYQHIAEKVHAIWRPRDVQSSRVKDLVDLILMASLDSKIDANTLQKAIVIVFENRGDQVLKSFSLFPSSWQRRYQRLAKETQLHLHDFQEAAQAADAFVTPVISGQVIDLTWDPEYWCWK